MMQIILILSFLTVITIICKLAHTILWVPWKIRAHFNKQGISGPPYRPIFGNTSEIRQMYAHVQSKPVPRNSIVEEDGPLSHDICYRVMPFYDKWSVKYGKNFLYWFGTNPMLAIADPDMIKEVLVNSNGSFGKLKYNPLAKILFGGGLVGLEGDQWVFHRRIANQVFNMERVKSWIPHVVSSTMKTLENWEKIRGEQEEIEVEVHKEFHNLSADIISRTAFGSSYEEGKRIFELQEQQMHLVSLALRSIYVPGFRFLPTNKNRRRWKLEDDTREAIKLIIQNKETTATEHSKDLISLFLSTNDFDGKRERKLRLDEVIEECKTFYFAGKDTTANLLTWALILLATHPKWQEKARDEVSRVCGLKTIPTCHHITDLKLINMIINETMRLYPPAVMMKRRTMKEVKLKDLNIPAQTQLYLAMTVVHHDAELWGDDALKFNPMRFAEPRKHLASYFPFSLGPRVCIGQNLALIESRIVLAMIIQHYTFKLSPSYVHAPMQLMTLQPQFGAHIIFKKFN